MLRFIDQETIQNKRVLLRVDFDVTFDENRTITDDTRIQCNLPTIHFLLENHNKIICVAKLGRPKGRDPKFSLDIVVKRLQELLPEAKVKLIDDFLTADFTDQSKNELYILENIRFYPEEKKNEPEFTKKLASLADVYVNDAFSMAHRSEASTVGVTTILPSYGGLHLKKEITALSKILASPQHPFVVVLGGAKISTKIGLIKKMLTIGDEILLGGGLANTFLKAQGVDIKDSLYEKDGLDLAHELMALAKSLNKELLLPVDYVWSGSKILDIGEKTIEKYASIVQVARTVVWNGPMGMAEDKNYATGTFSMLTAMRSNKEATTVVGGGDTVAVIKDRPEFSDLSHVSTGGGAMLEYIEKGSLPAIVALENSG